MIRRIEDELASSPTLAQELEALMRAKVHKVDTARARARGVGT